MKVTKYPQSCLLLEKDGRRIVIDPGRFFVASYSVGDLGDIEAVLYTHQHSDHFDQSITEQLKATGAKLFGNAEVAALIGQGANLVEGGRQFTVAGFEVTPHDLPHCRIPGLEPPQNTGYIVDGNFFHPGDGVETEGVSVENLAVPIAGPDISPFDAVQFIESVGAKAAIPIHYHFFKEDPEVFAKAYGRSGGQAKIVILGDGQSVEV